MRDFTYKNQFQLSKKEQYKNVKGYQVIPNFEHVKS